MAFPPNTEEVSDPYEKHCNRRRDEVDLFKLMHILVVVILVGGMFFSYFVLRPGAAVILQTLERL